MEDVLQKLANLQYIDSRIDELKQLRGDLPEDILDIETDIKRQEARLQKLEDEKTNMEQEKKDLKLEIQDAEAKLEKYEDQQTSVRNNREYDALTKEIEAQKQVIENSKSRQEEVARREQEIEPDMEQAQARLNKVKTLHGEKKEELSEVVDSTESEEKKLLETREELADELKDRYMRSYQRLRDGLKNGLAVVPMEKGAAIGMVLPPQVQVEVRRKNKIIIDENSGRIVVDPSFFEKAEEELS